MAQWKSAGVFSQTWVLEVIWLIPAGYLFFIFFNLNIFDSPMDKINFELLS
jgi:hypothetical protein